MLTKEQLAVLISKRATSQFSRDVYRLGVIMAQNNGELALGDIQRILITESEQKKCKKRIFSRREVQSVMSEEDNDRYYLMQLAFKIMDVKGVTMLTLQDLTSASIRPIYLKCFKKEYEEYEKQEYTFRDAPFRERALQIMSEFKNRTIPIENEM